MYRLFLPVAAIALSFALRSMGAEPAAPGAGSGATPAADEATQKKLFHVVSLKFKEGATKEQITEVEKAFKALKEKIPGIQSLNWGTNVSPEHRNKGFTHCFVLTFATEADRDAYLVHPEHKAFGGVLGPVKGEVMVIDFWSQPAAAAPAIGVGGQIPAKLYHVVSLKFKEGATKEQIGEVENAFAALKTKVPNIISLDWGTDVSPEHKNNGFTHCFVLRFPTDGDRDNYLTHAEHKAFGKVFGPVMGDVMVMDFWTE